jgi:lysophospholipase L1-like esterase
MCQGLLVTLEDMAPGARTDACEPCATVSTPSYGRYVAIGDSWTEGVGDPDSTRPNGLRGWADRVAEALAADREDFQYANLAIRGRTVEEILDEQLAPALDLKPDLLTLQGAGNDLLHVRVDIDALVGSIDAAVAKANDIGSRVVLFTHGTPAAGPFRTLRGRIAVFNELIREVVDTRDAALVDNWRLREARDPRYWDADRIHLSPFGHQLAAVHVLNSLGIRHDDEPLVLPEATGLTRRERLLVEVEWTRTFAGPWIYRRLRGRSLGDGITAKRPVLAPI